MAFSDPLVEPEQPPTIMITIIKILRKFGHVLKSSVTNPDVVLIDITLNAASRNEALKAASGREEDNPHVARMIPMIIIV